MPPTDTPETWPVVSSTDLHRDDWIVALRSDQVTRPGHDEDVFTRLVLEHPGAVVVLAVDDDDRVLVLHQYRHPVGERLVELPAGLKDVHGEQPLVTAQRELVEEAGLRAERWATLLDVYSSPGISNERVGIYLAEGLSEAEVADGYVSEHEEADMTRHWVPLDELVTNALEGTIKDALAVVAVLALRVRRCR
jgi:8-oxo-dGDP phosphatase